MDPNDSLFLGAGHPKLEHASHVCSSDYGFKAGKVLYEMEAVYQYIGLRQAL